jgi:hypothetical protein
VLQLRDRRDLLVQDTLSLTRLERDQILRLVVVDDMNESQFRSVRLG